MDTNKTKWDFANLCNRICSKIRSEQVVTPVPDERKCTLFNKQKDMLDTFLSHGAIDRRQYEKSLTCMAEKMGMQAEKITEH